MELVVYKQVSNRSSGAFEANGRHDPAMSGPMMTEGLIGL